MRIFTLQLILIILIIAAPIQGAYVAPAKDTMMPVGETGNQSGKNADNAGVVLSVWIAEADPSKFMKTNGEVLDTCSGGAISDNGSGKIRITSNGDFDDAATTGVLVWCDFSATYDDGIYEVITIDGSDNYIDIELAYSSDVPTVDCRVGGAIDTLQNALDSPLNNGASYNRHIYSNITTETITASIDVDQFNGSATTRIFIIGYSSDFSAESEIKITTTTDLAGTGALITFGLEKGQYTRWHKINLDGGGKDASRAEHCIEGSGTNDGKYAWFVDCKFNNAESDSVQVRGTGIELIGCELNLNGGDGYANVAATTYAAITDCSIHDNDFHGIAANSSLGGNISGNLIYDNGKDGAGDGMNFSAAIGMTINDNTIYGNAGDGGDFPVGSARVHVYNNTVVGNDDYGFQLNSAPPVVFYFGYNHAYDNDQSEGIAAGEDYCSATASEAAFQTFRDGNNKTGDPKFTSVADGSEDFMPASGSDLINNGLEFGGTGTQDIGAIQEASPSAGGGQSVLGGGIVR